MIRICVNNSLHVSKKYFSNNLIKVKGFESQFSSVYSIDSRAFASFRQKRQMDMLKGGLGGSSSSSRGYNNDINNNNKSNEKKRNSNTPLTEDKEEKKNHNNITKPLSEATVSILPFPNATRLVKFISNSRELSRYR